MLYPRMAQSHQFPDILARDPHCPTRQHLTLAISDLGSIEYGTHVNGIVMVVVFIWCEWFQWTVVSFLSVPLMAHLHFATACVPTNQVCHRTANRPR